MPGLVIDLGPLTPDALAGLPAGRMFPGKGSVLASVLTIGPFGGQSVELDSPDSEVTQGVVVESLRRKMTASGTALIVVAALLAVALPRPRAADAAPEVPSATDRYIVVLDDEADAEATSLAIGLRYGLAVGHIYGHALSGFAAVVPAGRLAALKRDPRVQSIQSDSVVSLDHCIPGNPVHDAHCSPTTTTTTTTTTTSSTSTTTTASPTGQTVPTGVARIGGAGTLASPVGVAVIDTGIDIDHPDLNVVGGYNCSSGPASKFDDGNGHGTHVAGTIGAKDNGLGVVGVAPGASLYAVRVLNNSGFGFLSDILCGIDWVTAHSDQIAVTNMSLGGNGTDDGKSCAATTDAYKKAICNAVGSGITFVVAAGNESENASGHLPAAYDMVITVSALADFNGEAGGGAPSTCRNDQDDSFADFSNYGQDVDLIAPGVCILSTWPGGGTNTISGTSMATPHVTGVAALYVAAHQGASPDAVLSALRTAGSSAWDSSDDPDGIKEPLVQTP